jgi:hypothetical protein
MSNPITDYTSSKIGDAVDAVKHFFGADRPSKVPAGSDHKSLDAVVDEAAGSPPPKQNQSTDHANGY